MIYSPFSVICIESVSYMSRGFPPKTPYEPRYYLSGGDGESKGGSVNKMKKILMQWKVEVGYKPTATDAMGEGRKKDIEDLGISGVNRVKTMQLYMIAGDLSESDVKSICENLLTDRITQLYAYKSSLVEQDDAGAWVVEVTYKHGVTDPVGDSTVKGIGDLGIGGVSSAKTGQKYVIKGSLSEDDVEVICKRLLANDVIQNYSCERVIL